MVGLQRWLSIWTTKTIGTRRKTTVVRFKWRTLVVSGFSQVSYCCGWLQMENDGGHPGRTTVVSFIWSTIAMIYRPRAAVVGFKWSTLVVVGFSQTTTVLRFRWITTALGYRRKTTVVGFKLRTLVLSDLLQVNNYSGWLQMKKPWWPSTENDSGELHMGEQQWWA